jgi:3D (Asp-Asp-Asp) domain-containing protein
VTRIAASIVWQAVLAVLVVGAAYAPGLDLPGPAPSSSTPNVARPEPKPAAAVGFVVAADRPKPPLGRFKLTAYSGPQMGQKLPITATGTAAHPGRTVAVDPRIIPLGAVIYIDGLGERIAEDVGGAVRGNHVDVYLPSLAAARRFGVRYGTVSVVKLPRGEV